MEAEICNREKSLNVRWRKSWFQERWNSLEHGLKNVAEKVCGRSKGGKKCEEMWWWNEQVAKVIKRKKERYKKWGKTGVKRIGGI